MLWIILLKTVSAIILRDSRSGLFLGQSSDRIVMTPYPVESLDISIQNTEPTTVSTILSLGTKALSVVKGSHKLDIVDMQRNDKTQFFKLVLVDRDKFVLQHNDLCVGYSNFFANTLPGIEGTSERGERGDSFPKVEMVDCGDTKNVLTFLKSERIDGEIRTRKMVSYVEPLDDIHHVMDPHEIDPHHGIHHPINHPIHNPINPYHHGMVESIDVKKYHQDVIKPEETGFLRGVSGRVNHLF